MFSMLKKVPMRSKNSIYNMIIGILYLVSHILFSFCITALIIKFFGSTANGIIASVKQISSYVAILDGGFGAACIMSYYGPLAQRDETAIREVFYASKKFYKMIGKLYLIALTVCSLFFAIFKGEYFGAAYTFLLILVVGGGIGLQYLFIENYKTIIIADQKNRYVQMLILLSEFLYFAAAIVLIQIMNVKNLLLVEIFNLLGIVIQMIYCRSFVKENYKFLFDKRIHNPSTSMRSIKQKKETLIYAITTHISYNTDIIILTVFRTFSEVSIYSVYNMVISVVNYVFSVLTTAVSSSFGNLYQECEKKFNRVFDAYEFVCLIINTALAISILFVMKAFILFYTKGSEINYWNQSIALMFILNVFLNNIRSPYSIIIKVSQSYDRTQKIFIMEAVLNIGVSVALVPYLGIIGVLAGTFLSALLRDLFIINLVCSDILKIPVKRKIVKITINLCLVVGAAILASTVLDFEFNSVGQFIAGGVISLTGSIAIIVLLNSLLDYKQCKSVCKMMLQYMRIGGD